MALIGRDIICFSTHYWDERWFRKQEFMSRFSRANRVLFVEPSFSSVRAPEEFLRGIATNRHLRPRIEQRAENIHLLKPPRGLPGWSNPRIERASYRWFGRVVAQTAGALGFRDPILWVYRPAFAHAVDVISHDRLVFDLVDDLAAYGGDDDTRAAHVEQLVQGLVRRSDLLVVTAKTLAQRYGPQARAVEHVANGFDASRFSSERDIETPEAIAEVPRPLLGFIGTLFPFLDFDLLEAVARFHSDKSLVLVGPVEASAAMEVERLVALPNVFHVGRQPQSEMPAYVAAFDVCLNPFRRSRVSDSVNPLKVYEYLAGGRPVVSTPMEALRLEDAGRMVAFAEGSAAFCDEIQSCLTPEVQAQSQARRAAAAPYSWERLFERLDAACDRVLTRPT